MQKFSSLPYVRPDLAAYKKEAEAHVEKVRNAESYEALEYGTSGEAVYKLKLRLAELGYLTEFLPGYEDIFDEHTLFAITNVQYIMGVIETDGIATPELQAFLYSEHANKLKIAE